MKDIEQLDLLDKLKGLRYKFKEHDVVFNISEVKEKENNLDIGDDKTDKDTINQAKKLIEDKYSDLFFGENQNLTLEHEHRIRLLEDKGFIRCGIRRRKPEEHKIIEEETNKFLAKGLIRPSRSSYLSPVVLVKKMTR